jgi:hypothetical protein
VTALGEAANLDVVSQPSKRSCELNSLDLGAAPFIRRKKQEHLELGTNVPGVFSPYRISRRR